MLCLFIVEAPRVSKLAEHSVRKSLCSQLVVLCDLQEFLLVCNAEILLFQLCASYSLF